LPASAFGSSAFTASALAVAATGLAASVFTGSAAFGASTFLSAAAGAGAVTLAAGAEGAAGAALPCAKEAETKPAATVRATINLETCILNLLDKQVVCLVSGADNLLQRHVPNNATGYEVDVMKKVIDCIAV
jgi:hypothetical protein